MQALGQNHGKVHNVLPLRLVRWMWPQTENVKLNVDGTSRGNPGKAGFGGLLRGDDGRWIFGFKGSMGVADNLLPELMMAL